MDSTFTFHTFNDPADPPFGPDHLTFNNLLGINNEGLIVAFYGSGAAGDPNQGFQLKNGDFTPENFPESAQIPEVKQTQVTGLNDTGITVGYFYKTNLGVQFDNQFGFYESCGVFHEVNNPNTPTNPNQGVLIENQLLGVNDHDIAVGFYNDKSGNSHGYTYNINTGKFSADINDPNASSTVTAAINNLGEIAGFYTDKTTGVMHGFVDINGHFTTVTGPGTNVTETQLLGINDLGIAVGFDVDSTGMHGIIFNSHTGAIKTLDDPHGIGATTFNGINDRGQIVGFYVDSHGNTDGLLASPHIGLTGLAMAGDMMHA